MKFTWKQNGKGEKKRNIYTDIPISESSSDISMQHNDAEDTFVSQNSTISFTFNRYSFEIEAGGEVTV